MRLSRENTKKREKIFFFLYEISAWWSVERRPIASNNNEKLKHDEFISRVLCCIFLCFYFEFLFYINTCVNIFFCLSTPCVERAAAAADTICDVSIERVSIEGRKSHACALLRLLRTFRVETAERRVCTRRVLASVVVSICRDEEIEFREITHCSDVVEYMWNDEGPLAFSHGITAIYIFILF